MKNLLIFTFFFAYMANEFALARNNALPVPTSTDDATLSQITVTPGVLNEVVNPNDLNYTCTVPFSATKITVVVVKSDSLATVNETYVDHPLNAEGGNTLTFTVKSQDESVTKIYTLTVIRQAASTDATLSSLAVSPGSLDPVFSPETMEYTVTGVPSTTTQITLTPTSHDANANINGGGEKALISGENNFNIIVTAENGTTKKTYKVKVVTEAVSTDATLSGLTVTGGVLSPGFTSGTLSYTVIVDYATTQTVITATKNDTKATVAGDIGTKLLEVGDNIFNITVKAEDGSTTKTYTVKVVRNKNKDATLKKINLSTGTLSPTFNSETLSYTVNVPLTTTVITLRAEKNDPNAGVTADFVNFPLQEGVNNFAFMVTAHDGTTTKTYAVKVIRGGKTDATLKNITLSTGTLSPTFVATTTSYTVNVPTTTSLITIRSVKNDADATVTADFVSKTLNNGDNTFTFTVTAQDGVTKKTYTVKVIRGGKTDANLKSITLSTGTLSPTFTATTTSYTVNVPYTTSVITIRSVKNDADATVTADFVSQTLRDGDNTYTFTVTAQDGTTKKIYTVKVVRGIKTDANLKALTLSTGTLSPQFNPAVYLYRVNVAKNVSSIQITGSQNNAYARVAGAGTHQLKTGKNVITLTITAEDNTTKKTYTIEVTRADWAVANEEISSSELKVYPTLTKDKVYIETSNTSYPLVYLYSTTGKLLQTVHASEVDLSSYSKGIYILRIEDRVVKVVKE